MDIIGLLVNILNIIFGGLDPFLCPGLCLFDFSEYVLKVLLFLFLYCFFSH